LKNKRRLSEKSRRILQLIDDGQSYGQIIDQHVDLRYQDIFKAAEEALQQQESSSEYRDRLVEIRSKYANAYFPWPIDSDSQLVSMHQSGIGLLELASHFCRQPSAIRSRLEKLRLKSATSETEAG
jgi:predicted ArsR family transcriptional regulator